MKFPSVAIATVFGALTMFATSAVAGPDFSMIEKARIQKKAEMEKQQSLASKCLIDKLADARSN